MPPPVAVSRDVPAPTCPPPDTRRPRPTAGSRRPRSRTSPRWSGRRCRRCIPADGRSSPRSPRPPASPGSSPAAARSSVRWSPPRPPPSSATRTASRRRARVSCSSPADGTVALVSEVVPPPELDLPRVPAPRVSVFLSVLDVHVQRIPADGRVVDVAVPAGPVPLGGPRQGERGQRAQRDAAGDRRRRPRRRRADRRPARAADRLPRRPGDEVAAGETYGLIRFGSRVDTYLPAGSTVSVEVGQRTVGGETVLAELPGRAVPGPRPRPG